MNYAVDLHGWPGLDESLRTVLVSRFRTALEGRLGDPEVLLELLHAHLRIKQAHEDALSLKDLEAAVFYAVNHRAAEDFAFSEFQAPPTAYFEAHPAH